MATASIKSPFYRRKSAQFDESKHSRDAGKFSSHPGAAANPDGLDHLRPSKITPTPEEKTAYYADELKKKYGDKVLEKITAVKAKYASDPAKVAALEAVEAKLSAKPQELPPSEPVPEFNLKQKPPSVRSGLPSPLKEKAADAERAESHLGLKGKSLAARIRKRLGADRGGETD